MTIATPTEAPEPAHTIDPAHASDPAQASDRSATQVHRWRWIGLAVILAAEVMDLLDALVTTIAGPSIRVDLGGTESLIQWLGAAYTLAMAVGLVTGGRLGDLFGRRLMFMIGAAGFVASSLVCALAQNPGMLITSRVTQGLFGALMLPQGLGMIKQMFSPKEISAAFGAFGPVMGLSAVGGPILAGWLVTGDYFGLGWRLIFLINLPLGILAVLGAGVFLPASRSTHTSRLDLPGVAILSAGAVMVIYPLVQGRELGWPLWTYLLMGAGAVTFGLFTRYTRSVQRRGGEPLVTPSLFRKRAFTGGLLAGGAFFSGMIGFTLVFSLYLQVGLGDSPLKTGLAAVPQALGMVIGFVVASAGLSARLGRRLLHAGLVVMAAGVALFAVILHAAGTAGVTPWHLAPALAVVGFGTGLLMAPFFDLILTGVEEHEMGSASGSLNAVQQLGGALGIAILGTVFFDILKVGRTGPVPATVEHGMQATLWIEVGLFAVTFAAAFLLPKRARAGEPA
jgi:EmrB/QacA subfamily drug resistance transporter